MGRPKKSKAEEPRKAGRPKGERDDVAVKIDRRTVGKARMVATDRGVSLAEYLSGLISNPVDRDYSKLVVNSAKRIEGD